MPPITGGNSSSTWPWYCQSSWNGGCGGLLHRQVAAAVARVAVLGPDEAVDRLLRGRARRGSCSSGSGVAAGSSRNSTSGLETSSGCGEATKAAARAREHQQRDRDAEHDPPPAPLALLRGHAPSRVPACPPRSSSGCARCPPPRRCSPRWRASRASGSSAAPSATCCWAASRRARPRRRGRRARRRAARGGAARRRAGRARALRHRHGARPSDVVFDLAGARRETLPAAGRAARGGARRTLAEDLARRDFTRQHDRAAARGRGAAASARARGTTSTRACCASSTTRSFRDDPTRLLRLARYAGRLGFDGRAAHRRARAAGARPPARSAPVSGERLGAELRLLAREPQPAALVALAADGAGAALLPGFDADAALVRARALALRAAGRARRASPRSARRSGAPARTSWRRGCAQLGLPAIEARGGRRLRRPRRAARRARAARARRRSDALLLRAPVEAAVLAAAAGAEARATGSTRGATLRPEHRGARPARRRPEGPAVGARPRGGARRRCSTARRSTGESQLARGAPRLQRRQSRYTPRGGRDAATTSATPRTSPALGIWPSTTIPITVAVAGSSETISA